MGGCIWSIGRGEGVVRKRRPEVFGEMREGRDGEMGEEMGG